MIGEVFDFPQIPIVSQTVRGLEGTMLKRTLRLMFILPLNSWRQERLSGHRLTADNSPVQPYQRIGPTNGIHHGQGKNPDRSPEGKSETADIDIATAYR